MKRFKTLKNNNKYLLLPPKNQSDIKTLVRQMAVAGAGRELDGGLPPGPWTPEQLADAISQIEGNSAGIDLRTVQLWFQENERGISAQNIRWLARIFGCGDPDAIREWQIELHAAQDRLNAKRRSRRKENLGDAKESRAITDIEPVASKEPIGPRPNLAQVCIGLFTGKSPVNLVSSLVAGSVALGFLAYVLGVHDITYTPVPGVEKQVGYFWAPNWTLVNLVLLPAYLIFVTSAVHYEGTVKCGAIMQPFRFRMKVSTPDAIARTWRAGCHRGLWFGFAA